MNGETSTRTPTPFGQHRRRTPTEFFSSHLARLGGKCGRDSRVHQPASYLFVVVYMLSVPLETSFGEILQTLGNLNLMGRALLANFVIIPILGILIATFRPARSRCATSGSIRQPTAGTMPCERRFAASSTSLKARG